jgi:hypothetical protein
MAHRRTAGPSTTLRFGRDDKSVCRQHPALPNKFVIPSEAEGSAVSLSSANAGCPIQALFLGLSGIPQQRISFVILDRSTATLTPTCGFHVRNAA